MRMSRFLKLFYLYDFDTIDQDRLLTIPDPAARHGQIMLAEYVVKLIFLTEAARQAQMITTILFGRGDVMETITWLMVRRYPSIAAETVDVSCWIHFSI